jgi:hypothetical protein
MLLTYHEHLIILRNSSCEERYKIKQESDIISDSIEDFDKENIKRFVSSLISIN